jgi:hypothetical protein
MSKSSYAALIISAMALAVAFSGLAQGGADNTGGAGEYPSVKAGSVIVPGDGLTFETEDGKVIAKLYADEYGGKLLIANNDGLDTVRIGNDGRGGFLDAFDHYGNFQAALACDRDGGELWLFDYYGHYVGSIKVTLDGDSIEITDDLDRAVWPPEEEE